MNNYLLLITWLILGSILRFTNLDLKPASSIEIATIGYSLGHGFSAIPLDQIISLETLLSPLGIDFTIGYPDVLQRLMQESTHPPLYFWLTHWWIKLWVQDSSLVSLQIGRSLSAIFGVLAIPGMFGLGWVAFRSRWVGHLAAVLMAISPYGIYLAQEARHYTLTILWVIASITCLIRVIQLISQRIPIPIWLGLVWILVNALGVATHYFFILALGAEAIAVVGFWLFNYRQISFKYWYRLGIIGCGTLASCLVWLPVVRGISDNDLTSWIQTSYEFKEIWEPIPRLLAWMITMVMLLPIEGTALLVTILSAVVILIILIWTIPILIQGLRSQLVNPQTCLPMIILGSYLLGAIAIVFLVIYGLRKDISLAARYHFVYFPVLLVIIAACCSRKTSALPNSPSIGSKFYPTKNNQVIILLLIMGLLGSITVVSNYGFQKSRHSDRLAAYIQENSTFPTVVAMTYQTNSELRELMGLALSFHRLNSQDRLPFPQLPQFLLVQQNKDEANTDLSSFSKILKAQPKPLDLIAVNLKIEDTSLSQLDCTRDTTIDLANSGYRDRFYHCNS